MIKGPISAKKPDANAKFGIFYGYIIVACSFLILVLCFGINYSFGTFFNALLQDFGWSRAITSVGYSVSQFVGGVMGICTGRFTDRFGPKPIIIFCGISLALGCFMMSLVNQPWQLYLFYGFFVGLGFGGAFIPLVTTISRWFVWRRGLMTGIAVSGNGFGTIVIPLLATGLLSLYSWQTSFIIIAALALLVIVPAALFLKRDPSDIGQTALGSGETLTSNQSKPVSELTFFKASRTARFWIVCLIYILIGFFVQSVMLHIVPYAKTQGIDALNAALILSFCGIGSTLGRIGMGSISDRIGLKYSLIIIFAIAVMSFAWLHMAGELWKLLLFGAVFGVSYGGTIAMESLIGAKLYGLSSLGTIVGVIVFAYTCGGAIGATITGYIFDITGTYTLAFLLSTILASLALVLVFFIRDLAIRKPIN